MKHFIKSYAGHYVATGIVLFFLRKIQSFELSVIIALSIIIGGVIKKEKASNTANPPKTKSKSQLYGESIEDEAIESFLCTDTIKERKRLKHFLTFYKQNHCESEAVDIDIYLINTYLRVFSQQNK